MGETEGHLTMNLLSAEVNGKNWRIACMQNWTLVHAVWKAALFVRRFSYMQPSSVSPKIPILRAVTRLTRPLLLLVIISVLLLSTEELLLSTDSLTRKALVIIINYWNIMQAIIIHIDTLSLRWMNVQPSWDINSYSPVIWYINCHLGLQTVLTMSGIYIIRYTVDPVIDQVHHRIHFTINIWMF